MNFDKFIFPFSDTCLLAAQMTERNMTPSIISRGNSLMNMSLPSLNINYNDTFLYIKSSLAKCCKLYDIPMMKGIFPVRANTPPYYETCKIPPFKLFVNENDEKKDMDEKKKWYEHRRKRPWIFKDEICN